MCKNGVAGCGWRKACRRSLADREMMSIVDVCGILTWAGKNSMVGLILVLAVRVT
jgi:hypothetical protein